MTNLHEIALNEFLALSDNWDGDDAPAPNTVATNNMKIVFAALRIAGLRGKKLRATVDGGVMLDFETVGYADVECTNEGEILWVIKEFQKPCTVWESGQDAASISDSIRRVKEFIECVATKT